MGKRLESLTQYCSTSAAEISKVKDEGPAEAVGPSLSFLIVSIVYASPCRRKLLSGILSMHLFGGS